MATLPKEKRKKKGLKRNDTINGEIVGIRGDGVPPPSSAQFAPPGGLDSFMAPAHGGPASPPPPPPSASAPAAPSSSGSRRGPRVAGPRSPPPPARGGGSDQFIEKEITLPQNAKPGMKVSVKVDGSEARFTLPHGAKPGMKIKVKVKRRAASTQANLAHDNHRAVDDRGNFIRPAQSRQAPPRSARDVVQNVRGETNRMFGGMTGRRRADPVGEFFEDWKKWEMCELLVMQNIELKDISHLNLPRLKKACTQVFKKRIKDGDLPQRPEKPPLTKMLYMESLVRKVQERWFNLRAAKMSAKSMAHAEQHARTMRIGVHGSDRGYGQYKKNYHDLEGGIPSKGKGKGKGDVEEGSPEVDFMDQKWEMPTGEAVEEYINESHPRIPSLKGGHRPYPLTAKLGRHCCLKGCGEQLDLWDEGKVSEFAQFGAGIVLYFKFVKVMYWVFITLSFLFLPVMMINTLGDGIPVSIGSIGSTTIGNLGGASNFSQMSIPGCETFKYLAADYINTESVGDDDETNCVVDKGQLGIFYGLVDAIAVLIILFAIGWLKEFEAAEVDDLDRNTVSPSDFTIFLPWVPPECTEADLKKYFAKNAPAKNTICGARRAIKPKPVYLTFFGHDDGDLISAFKDHGDLEYQKYLIGQTIRFYRTRASLKYSDHKIRHVTASNCLSRLVSRHCRGEYNDVMEADLLYDRKRILKKIDDALEITESEKRMKKWKTPLCAFVSFKDEEMVEQAMADMQRSMLEKVLNYFGCMVAHHKVLEIGGKKCFLGAQKACAPSTIVWENYRYGPGYRFRARQLTNILSFVFIVFSIVVRAIKEHYDWTRAQDAGDQPDDDGYCAKFTDDELMVVGESNWDGDDAMVTCYCTELLQNEGLRELGNDKRCQDFSKEVSTSMAFEFAGVAVIALSNMLIMILINKRAKEEKHQSLDGQEVSVMVRGFIAKFANTGLIFLILGMSVTQRIIGKTDLNNNLNVDWYEIIAPDVVIISLTNIVAPSLPVLKRYRSDFLARKKIDVKGVDKVDAKHKTDGIYCQDQLDKKYLGPDFHLHIRYIQLLVNFYMVMLYGMGIPILFPIAAIQFFLTFWFDKFMFIRYYRKPPQFDHTTGQTATGLLWYGAVMHLAASIWMLTNADIFSSDDGGVSNPLTDSVGSEFPEVQRLFYNQSIVLSALLFLVIVYTFASKVLSKSASFMNTILKVVTCQKQEIDTAGVRNLVSGADNEPITYPEARKRGLIQGLDTYNILINPIYREMFRIPLNWVRKLGSDRPKHKHVWSVKKFDPENPNADDDVDPEAVAAVDELKITHEQYRDYKEAFDSYDKDGGGTLDQDELMHAMKSLGYDPSENDVAEYLQAADEDHNGVIDFPEFVKMMQVQTTGADNDEIKEAFEMFDKNGDGSLSAAELRYMMTSYGRRMTDPEVDEMISIADTNGDKEIDYNEFIALMASEESKMEKKGK